MFRGRSVHPSLMGWWKRDDLSTPSLAVWQTPEGDLKEFEGRGEPGVWVEDTGMRVPGALGTFR